MSDQKVILTGHSMPDKFDNDLSAWMRSKITLGSKNDGGKLSFVIVHLSCFVQSYSNSMPVFNKQQQDLPQSVGL